VVGHDRPVAATVGNGWPEPAGSTEAEAR
jgi:hypothetical protein